MTHKVSYLQIFYYIFGPIIGSLIVPLIVSYFTLYLNKNHVFIEMMDEYFVEMHGALSQGIETYRNKCGHYTPLRYDIHTMNNVIIHDEIINEFGFNDPELPFDKIGRYKIKFKKIFGEDMYDQFDILVKLRKSAKDHLIEKGQNRSNDFYEELLNGKVDDQLQLSLEIHEKWEEERSLDFKIKNTLKIFLIN